MLNYMEPLSHIDKQVNWNYTLKSFKIETLHGMCLCPILEPCKQLRGAFLLVR